MLYVEFIHWGHDAPKPEDSLWRSENYFDICGYQKFITTDLAKSIILEIDKSEVINENLVMSPVLGGISPRDLSSGCKTVLVMIYTHEYRFFSQRLGRNCFAPLLRASLQMDAHILIPDGPCIPKEPVVPIYVENTGELVTNGRPLADVNRRLRDEGFF